MEKETYRVSAPTINKTYEGLTEEEMFDKIDELAAMFYATGSPDPNSIVIEVI